MTDEGLTTKYRVERLKPPESGTDHSNCQYFVLDPQHDPVARVAINVYASLVREEGNHRLADQLDAWIPPSSNEIERGGLG